MNLKTHTGYPEGQGRLDGTYQGIIYSVDGQVLAHIEGLSDKEAYKAWVTEQSRRFVRQETP